MIKPKKKVKVIEYFTDEMHKDIFPFQPPMTHRSSGGKAVMKPVSLSLRGGKK